MQNILSGKKTNKLWVFLACVFGTVAIGTLSGLFSGSMNGYDGINMPSFAPPSWIFGIVWTVLYVMMGISLYLVLTFEPLSTTENAIKTASIVLWGAQLAVNLLWPFIFFNVDYTVAFVLDTVIVALVTSLVTLNFFIRPLSAVMLLPYWGWLLYAAYQTLLIIILNA